MVGRSESMESNERTPIRSPPGVASSLASEYGTADEAEPDGPDFVAHSAESAAAAYFGGAVAADFGVGCLDPADSAGESAANPAASALEEWAAGESNGTADVADAPAGGALNEWASLISSSNEGNRAPWPLKDGSSALDVAPSSAVEQSVAALSAAMQAEKPSRGTSTGAAGVGRRGALPAASAALAAAAAVVGFAPIAAASSATDVTDSTADGELGLVGPEFATVTSVTSVTSVTPPPPLADAAWGDDGQPGPRPCRLLH